VALCGLVALSVLGLSAVSAANALASGQPKFETESGEIKGTTFTGTGGAGVLETTAGDTVSCKGNTSSGELNSATTVKNVLVKFTGCSTSISGFKAPCKTTGAAAEEIRTNALKGETAYLIKGSNRAGLDLQPEAAGGSFAVFGCTLLGQTATLTVTGSVVGELTPVNAAFGTAFTLTLNQTKGVQEFTKFLSPANCESVEDILKTKSEGAKVFGPTQSGVQGTEKITTSKNIKIVSNKTDCP